MKLTRKEQFENLQLGDWLENCDGIFEVTDEYNSNRDCIGLAEVLTSEKGGYSLINENPNTTFVDVKYSELI